MKTLHLWIDSLDSPTEKTLREWIRNRTDWNCVFTPDRSDAEIIVTDKPGRSASGQTTVLVGGAGESWRVPENFQEFWSRPLREPEVEGTLRRARSMAALNAQMSDAIRGLEDNLSLAERMDRRLRTTRFDGIAGLRAASYYTPGERPGGDYFDIAENREKTRVLILLSDSSSYGLASSVMAGLLKLSTHLGVEGPTPPSRLIETVWAQISQVMKPKDVWSIFMGVLQRKTLELDYCHIGNSRITIRTREGTIRTLESHGSALRAGDRVKDTTSGIVLEPGSRLVAVSDGVLELPEGDGILKSIYAAPGDPQAAALDLKFEIQKRIGKEALPAQDCTIGVMEIDEKVLRLATRARGGSGHSSDA